MLIFVYVCDVVVLSLSYVQSWAVENENCSNIELDVISFD